MPAAARAVILRARIDEVVVVLGFENAGNGREEARPAGAAVEFHVGGEERQVAARAGKDAGAFFGVERARARALGAFFAQDVVLHLVEALAPLVVGELHLVGGRGRLHALLRGACASSSASLRFPSTAALRRRPPLPDTALPAAAANNPCNQVRRFMDPPVTRSETGRRSRSMLRLESYRALPARCSRRAEPGALHAHSGRSEPKMTVHWLDRTPPLPCARATSQSGTWRSPHSPRTWRIASIMTSSPYMPGWQ